MDWSAISARDTTLMDCGTSRRAVNVRVLEALGEFRLALVGPAQVLLNLPLLGLGLLREGGVADFQDADPGLDPVERVRPHRPDAEGA